MSDAILNTLQYTYDNVGKVYSVVDCVNQEVMLHKLSVYGVRGVALVWFRS